MLRGNLKVQAAGGSQTEGSPLQQHSAPTATAAGRSAVLMRPLAAPLAAPASMAAPALCIGPGASFTGVMLPSAKSRPMTSLARAGSGSGDHGDSSHHDDGVAQAGTSMIGRGETDVHPAAAPTAPTDTDTAAAAAAAQPWSASQPGGAARRCVGTTAVHAGRREGLTAEARMLLGLRVPVAITCSPSPVLLPRCACVDGWRCSGAGRPSERV